MCLGGRFRFPTCCSPLWNRRSCWTLNLLSARLLYDLNEKAGWKLLSSILPSKAYENYCNTNGSSSTPSRPPVMTLHVGQDFPPCRLWIYSERCYFGSSLSVESRPSSPSTPQPLYNRVVAWFMLMQSNGQIQRCVSLMKVAEEDAFSLTVGAWFFGENA